MKKSRKRYNKRVRTSIVMMFASGVLFYFASGVLLEDAVCIFLWLVSIPLLWLTVGPGWILVRKAGIEEARKRRIAREFNEAWMSENKKFLKKERKRIAKEIDISSRGCYWSGGEFHYDKY